MPDRVRRDIGQALYTAQQSLTDAAAKPLNTAQFGDAIYVLHVFQKKSKHGIATPKHDIDLIRRRLAVAERDFRERQN